MLDTFPQAEGRQFETCLTLILYAFFIPCSLFHVHSNYRPLSAVFVATSTQASFKHRNSQLALSSSYLTSCCRTHDNNPTCAHSTPARHRAATGAVFTMCVCAWRASALSYLLMHGRSVMLSQTAHQRVLFGVCGPPGCTSRVRGLLLLATPFSSPIPPRHSHAAGPAVRIPCLCMRSPCPMSSPRTSAR